MKHKFGFSKIYYFNINSVSYTIYKRNLQFKLTRVHKHYLV